MYIILYAKIREKIPRDVFTSLSELLSKARIEEETFNFDDSFESSDGQNESKGDIKRKFRSW